MSNASPPWWLDAREAIRLAMDSHAALQVEDGTFDRRASITLLLRPTPSRAVETLFVRRAEIDGDPWSGHMALPGGREDAADADLLDTARRETREETGVNLERTDFLGRLDDVPPVTRRLPSIVVTPFVAWTGGGADVRENHELSGHVWIPLAALASPGNRGAFRRPETRRVYPTIEYQGHTIWGLTYRVVEGFLGLGPVAGLAAREDLPESAEW